MLTDFHNSFIAGLGKKFAATLMLHSHRTLNVSLHYLVKYKTSKNSQKNLTRLTQ